MFRGSLPLGNAVSVRESGLPASDPEPKTTPSSSADSCDTGRWGIPGREEPEFFQREWRASDAVGHGIGSNVQGGAAGHLETSNAGVAKSMAQPI